MNDVINGDAEGSCSFAIAGPLTWNTWNTWNSLPALIRNNQLPFSFRCELKPELLIPSHIINTSLAVCNCNGGQTITLSIHHRHQKRT